MDDGIVYRRKGAVEILRRKERAKLRISLCDER
jgi:hypothetical protein